MHCAMLSSSVPPKRAGKQVPSRSCLASSSLRSQGNSARCVDLRGARRDLLLGQLANDGAQLVVVSGGAVGHAGSFRRATRDRAVGVATSRIANRTLGRSADRSLDLHLAVADPGAIRHLARGGRTMPNGAVAEPERRGVPGTDDRVAVQVSLGECGRRRASRCPSARRPGRRGAPPPAPWRRASPGWGSHRQGPAAGRTAVNSFAVLPRAKALRLTM